MPTSPLTQRHFQLDSASPSSKGPPRARTVAPRQTAVALSHESLAVLGPGRQWGRGTPCSGRHCAGATYHTHRGKGEGGLPSYVGGT